MAQKSSAEFWIRFIGILDTNDKLKALQKEPAAHSKNGKFRALLPQIAIH